MEEGSATGLDNALNMLGMEEKEKSKNLKVLFCCSRSGTPAVGGQPGSLSQVKERVFRAWGSRREPEEPSVSCSIFLLSRDA